MQQVTDSPIGQPAAYTLLRRLADNYHAASDRFSMLSTSIITGGTVAVVQRAEVGAGAVAAGPVHVATWDLLASSPAIMYSQGRPSSGRCRRSSRARSPGAYEEPA